MHNTQIRGFVKLMLLTNQVNAADKIASMQKKTFVKTSCLTNLKKCAL